MNYLLLDKIRCLIPVLVTLCSFTVILMNETFFLGGKSSPEPLPEDTIIIVSVALVILVHTSLIFKPSQYIDRSWLWRVLVLFPNLFVLIIGTTGLFITTVFGEAFLDILLAFFLIFNSLCFYLFFIFSINDKWNNSLFLRVMIFLPSLVTSFLLILLYLRNLS